MGSPFLGVLMLDTRFPRLPGDIGHPDSFGWPVQHEVIPGAWPSRVVTRAEALLESGLAAAFEQAALRLQARGASAITTSCGFLVLLQQQLQSRVSIPVRTSSLLQLPGLLEGAPQVGVLTISAQALGPRHLLAAGVPAHRLPDVRVQGVDPEGEFVQSILGNQAAMDTARAQDDVVAAARALQARAPALTDLVLECTNMPPCADAIAKATGWRLHSLLTDPTLLQCRGQAGHSAPVRKP